MTTTRYWREIIITAFLLPIAKFLGPMRILLTIVLALPLLVIAEATGFTEIVVRIVKLPHFIVAGGMLVFCCAITLLIIFALTWALSFSVRAFKSASGLLVRGYQVLRSAYGTRQLAKRHIANAVAALLPQEKAFLELFRADGVALQKTTCEILPHQTYVAHRSLVKNGLVIKTEDARCFPVEHFALAAKAIPSLRKLFYDGKRPLTEIELRLDHVAHSGSSGSSPVGDA